MKVCRLEVYLGLN